MIKKLYRNKVYLDKVYFGGFSKKGVTKETKLNLDYVYTPENLFNFK